MEERVVHFRGNYVLSVTTQEDEGRTYEQVKMRPGVTVIPINEHGHIHAILEYDWYLKKNRAKLVTGYVEDGETPRACAERELREETGISASNWEEYVVSDNEEGAVIKKQTYFLASELQYGNAHPDADEKIIKVYSIAPIEALWECRLGTFGSTGTAFVLLKLAIQLMEEKAYKILCKDLTSHGTPT